MHTHTHTNNLYGFTVLGKREMFYLTTHSTHFIYGYMASDIWLRTILIVRKETRCRHIGYHPTDRITHTTAFVTPVVEHWLEREIAQWVHPMKDRSDYPSHHERTLLPRSYISLPHTHIRYTITINIGSQFWMAAERADVCHHDSKPDT